MPTTSPEVPENLSFSECTYIQLALPQSSNEGRVLSPSHVQLYSPGWKVQLEKVLSPPLGATQALVELSQGKHIPREYVSSTQKTQHRKNMDDSVRFNS